MKERAIYRERAVVAHHQAAEVSEPGVGAFDDPATPVPPQRSAILRRRFLAVGAMRRDQFDSAPCQPLAQRIAVVGFVGDHPHPLRPLAPLGFSDSAAPFFAGAKLPSKNDSLHFNCWRSFNSLRNARQTFIQTPCSSQSRSRRQQVEGCGYSSGKSCQRAPLRRIHRIPSRTRRLSIHGRPPLRCLRGLGSKGAIFFHCTSVSNGPDRAIGPPSALLTLLMHCFGKHNHHLFRPLYQVMQQLLGKLTSDSITWVRGSLSS